MQPEVHLITLTGPGGIGKTSLALSVSHDVQETFADGVCFVPLAAVHEPDLVLPAIAEALRQQNGNRPIFEIVQSFLQTKQLLLVLDNFEQVVTAAPQLTDLLRLCPSLKLLVTSRETLHVQGEHEFPVPPLDLPTLTKDQDNATLIQNNAIALFVQRIQEIKPDFRLTEANTPVIAEICIRLDGLPLALELAAARIKLLPPKRLLARLSNSLQVLTGGRQDAPARQRTLRDTIKWSYDLLTADEQRLFRRLCIFVGGCTLEAIEEFYKRLDDDPADIVDHITQLLDKNLLKSSGQSREGARLMILETIREFGLECLQEHHEFEQVQQAHARYYLKWAQTGSKQLFGPEQLLWMSDLLQEMGNLRAVMRFTIEHHEQEMALRLGGALGPLWMLLGTSNQRVYLVEGTQFLWQALEGSEGMATASRAHALVLYGGLFAWIDESKRSERVCREGLALFQQLGDLQGTIHAHWMLFLALFARCDLRAAHQVAQDAVTLARQYSKICTWWGASWTLGYSLFNVGMVAVYDGRTAEGRAALKEGIKYCTDAGDRFFSAWSALYFGEIVALEANKEEAHALLEQSLIASRALGMKTQESDALRFLGLLELRSGEIDQAETLLIESVRLSRETDDTQCIIWGLVWLARVKVARQELQEAQELIKEGVALAINRSDILTLPACLEGLGSIKATEDKLLWVVRLFACAHALREKMGEPIPPIDRQEYENLLESIRTRLDPTTFQEVWSQGLRLSTEQALTEPDEPTNATTPTKEPVRPSSPTTEFTRIGLTRREQDVLRLLAEGLTNAQIAQRLVLSTITVNSYLRAIYSKLNVSTRTAATRYALDHRLI